MVSFFSFNFKIKLKQFWVVCLFKFFVVVYVDLLSTQLWLNTTLMLKLLEFSFKYTSIIVPPVGLLSRLTDKNV